MESSFFHDLLRLNRLGQGWTSWAFLPGMLFRDSRMWWKEESRTSPHEGIDLLYLLDEGGSRISLPGDGLVPPLMGGEVAAIFDDFLGKTVAVRHRIENEQGWSLLSIYAHVLPMVRCADKIAAGTPLATLGEGKARGSGPPGHLHLSLAWAAPELRSAELAWPTMWHTQGLRLIDPLPLVQPPKPGNCGAE